MIYIYDGPSRTRTNNNKRWDEAVNYIVHAVSIERPMQVRYEQKMAEYGRVAEENNWTFTLTFTFIFILA